MIQIDLTALPNLTNDKFYPLYKNKNRYLVLMGGGGSGKSVFAAEKILVRTLSEDKHRILVIRKVGKTLRESTFALLKGLINDWGLSGLFTINKTDMSIKCMNGNEILFVGIDDPEKIKSIYNITSIWIEEASELTPEDFRQLDIRLRGKTISYKQMILTFNPISITHWLKTEFFDKHKKDSLTMHSTYKDNKFLDDEAKAVLEAFKDTDPYYYQVYCLGEWGVLGKTIFDAQIVTKRISELRSREFKKGYFEFRYVNEKIVDDSIEFIEDPNGYITIFEDKKGYYPYVLGGDTAGDGSDFFTAHVIDNTTGKQVAVFHNQMDEDLYTRQIYCLGKYYNYALVGIETNFSTYPIKELERLGYSNQYLREVPDTYTGVLQKKYGFRTTSLTRPVLISNLVKIVREEAELINDISTLDEMLTFVRNEKGRPQAQEGKHDDLIMGLGITYQIRDQQTYEVEIPPKKPSELPWMFRSNEREGGYINW